MTVTTYPRLGETVQREVLPNGLTVLLVPKPGFRRCYAFFATHYGGMDLRFEHAGAHHDTPAGIAHYLEHKMFDTPEGSAMTPFAQRGAEPNAFTSTTMTAYYFESTEYFDENLRTLLDFVSVPYFTDESVEKERGIIAQEIRMMEDSPDWQVYMQMMRLLYPESTFSTAIAGTVESIADIDADTLYACHKTFYDPANMALCVVGDVTMERVLAAARDVLPAQGGEKPAHDYGTAGEIAERRAVRTMSVAMPQFLAGWRVTSTPPGDAQMRQDLIADVAGDLLLGEASPLYNRLYDAKRINSSFGEGFGQLPGAAYAYAGGECEECEAVTAEIIAEAQRMAREGVNEAAFRRALRACFGTALRSLNSFENIAVSLCDGLFQGGDPFRLPEIFDSIRREDIEQFLRETYTEENCVLSIIRPGKEETA